ncbi:MAG: pyruvate dehydrogenase complex dihydrolipoamide acetyltransferase [Bradymonadaceae bacterium]
MAEVVNMIALSPTMDEGTLAEWRKNEGDQVKEGEVIADVETDKATMEMESWYDGTLLKVLAEAGSSVAVGDPIAIVGEEGEDVSDLLTDLESGGGAAAEPEAAQRTEPEREPGTEPEPELDEVEGEPEPTPPEAAEAEREAGDEGRLRASPLARRIAADKGISLRDIQGSGPAGRIIQRDVEKALETREKPTPERARAEAPTPAAEPEELTGEEVRLSQMRQTIAERLRSSWESTPHFFLTRQINMAETMERRASINEALGELEDGEKLSVNDFIVKACARALREYPGMNVSYRGDHIVQYDQINVAVAVAVEEGLVTPTIRNTDDKSLSKISRDAKRLAEKARNKNLKPEDYGDSTFTVSNLGMYGIDHFTAVINPPEAGILACGAVKEVPVVEDGELAVGTRMKVTLSCDHRAVDGAMGAEFLDKVKYFLEHPVLLTV